MIRRHSPLRLAPLLAILVLVVLAGCGGDDDAATAPTPEPTVAVATPTSEPTPEPTVAPTATAEPATPTPEPTPVPTATPPPVVTVNVYWAGVVDTVVSGTPERVLAGGRQGATATPARFAMEALLQGPDDVEVEIGLGTSIPDGVELLDLAIADGVATVDLSATFEQSSGSLDEFMRVAQVVFTLTQFDSVDGVRFRIDGDDRDAIASHGIDVSSPLDRDDFADVRPFILLERPYPGGSFASGDRIQGEANTFEANVQYAVVDWDGVIIAEGFTTATAGNGTWGRFDVEVILDSEGAGRGGVIVFDTSARDGSQINVIEIPIDLTGA